MIPKLEVFLDLSKLSCCKRALRQFLPKRRAPHVPHWNSTELLSVTQTREDLSKACPLPLLSSLLWMHFSFWLTPTHSEYPTLMAPTPNSVPDAQQGWWWLLHLWTLACLSVSCGCCNKMLQTGCLNTAVCCFTILETRSLIPGSKSGLGTSKDFEGESSLQCPSSF